MSSTIEELRLALNNEKGQEQDKKADNNAKTNHPALPLMHHSHSMPVLKHLRGAQDSPVPQDLESGEKLTQEEELTQKETAIAKTKAKGRKLQVEFLNDSRVIDFFSSFPKDFLIEKMRIETHALINIEFDPILKLKELVRYKFLETKKKIENSKELLNSFLPNDIEDLQCQSLAYIFRNRITDRERLDKEIYFTTYFMIKEFFSLSIQWKKAAAILKKIEGPKDNEPKTTPPSTPRGEGALKPLRRSPLKVKPPKEETALLSSSAAASSSSAVTSSSSAAASVSGMGSQRKLEFPSYALHVLSKHGAMDNSLFPVGDYQLSRSKEEDEASMIEAMEWEAEEADFQRALALSMG